MIDNKWITVPINEKGCQEYKDGYEHTENMLEYIIPHDEFRLLWKNRIFDIINNRFNLLIDDYESESVTADQLKTVYNAINGVKGVFLQAVNKAIEFGTEICLDF